MKWWRTEEKGLEAVGLSDEDFSYQVSARGRLVELVVVDRVKKKIVWYAVWNRKEQRFERGRKDE